MFGMQNKLCRAEESQCIHSSAANNSMKGTLCLENGEVRSYSLLLKYIITEWCT